MLARVKERVAIVAQQADGLMVAMQVTIQNGLRPQTIIPEVEAVPLKLKLQILQLPSCLRAAAQEAAANIKEALQAGLGIILDGLTIQF